MPLSSVQHRAVASRAGARLGTALAAIAAALGSAALAYWASSGQGSDGSTARKPPPAQVAPRVYAAAAPDAEAVRRAYERVGEVYSERGLPGVMEIADGCTQAVDADPRRLDFCVAFALDGAALAAGSEDPVAQAWQRDQAAAQLSVIRGALAPGADAAGRLVAIQGLTRAVVAPAPVRMGAAVRRVRAVRRVQPRRSPHRTASAPAAAPRPDREGAGGLPTSGADPAPPWPYD